MIYLSETKEKLEQEIEDNATTSEPTVEVIEEADGTSLEAELLGKDRLLEEANDRYKRLQADFDNFRRRTRQEKEELSNIVAQNVILELLPVLDNFERALGSVATQDADKMLSGVEMIYRQLAQVLEKSGLTTVEAVGKGFDPQQHEAVMRVEDAEQPDGTIVEELQKGYAVRGKVIRPSMVKVVSN
ncbi:nucleotide exchange factor GrpE [Pelosinus sp. UFO1]|uniref:nucleotide exchange factor GrpE n=1 Tax=Pelosinus sp. UFO1 TaxID=484770 RepID=UPI0004D12067|nr:nucleotide exchange factor GrpE [Pelosinus sp. UFO1]AIF52253.1 Protein grpE [Pelosinus sp. UFO1]